MALREQCWLTGEWIDQMGKYGDCGECHDMACPVKTGFEPGPKMVDDSEPQENNLQEEKVVEEKKLGVTREQCWATGEWIDEMGDSGNCYECHCMSCPVKTGFEPGPKVVEL